MSFAIIKKNDCNAVRNQLQHHPLSVGIAGFSLRSYRSGIFSDCDPNVNHAVLLIGYREGMGWRIKNTWGKNWG